MKNGKQKSPMSKPKTVPTEANVHDALVTAISELGKANTMLARIATFEPRDQTLPLLTALAPVIVAYLDRAMPKHEPRAQTAGIDPSLLNLLGTFTETQRTAILAVCTNQQSDLLRALFATVPVPMRPPAS